MRRRAKIFKKKKKTVTYRSTIRSFSGSLIDGFVCQIVQRHVGQRPVFVPRYTNHAFCSGNGVVEPSDGQRTLPAVARAAGRCQSTDVNLRHCRLTQKLQRD